MPVYFITAIFINLILNINQIKMPEKIKAGVLGATGMVGQKYISLLENHPWFEVSYVAASERSAGKTYAEAVKGRWHMEKDIPKGIESLIVQDANKVEKALDSCSFVFSAIEMDKEAIKKLELEYAKYIPVVSNNSAHRWTEDVPMLIPEINPLHMHAIPKQRENHNLKGFIVVKPNCTTQSFMTPLYALMENGFYVKRMIITTMQALSGAGYPGISALDIADNLIPYINGEEEKTESEPLKILGFLDDATGKITNYPSLKISSSCNRVNVLDGHTACVSLEFRKGKPELEEIISIWKKFESLPQIADFPSAPRHPIIYRDEQNRPQPKLDRDAENGMAVTVGRLRKCNVLDIKFTALVHNTIRGAAGGGILNAELLKLYHYLK